MADELLTRVQDTVAQTLKVPSSQITPTSSADTMDKWDSLAQVNLIMSLEETFDIELDVDEFMQMTSVKAIVDYLSGHGFA